MVEYRDDPGFLIKVRTRIMALAMCASMLGVDTIAADTIKVGVLHSLSGTMAISESPLKDTVLMLVHEQNRKGGLLGRRLEAVVVNPASNQLLFAEKARQLLIKEQVDVIFGCWTSASRRSVLPVLEKHNGLMFYPVQYEGEESSRNIFYTGATPNQQAIPAIDFLIREHFVERWVLAGTDYVYPRTINKILQAYLKSQGVAEEDIMLSYTPFGHKDWAQIVSSFKQFGSSGKKTAVVSSINGDANLPFYEELGRQGISSSDIPVMAFSVGEGELALLNAEPLQGHLAAWNYFQAADNQNNTNFIARWRAFVDDPEGVINDPIEATYIGFKLWVQAVEQAGTIDVTAVEPAMLNQTTENLTGGWATMNTNHHLSKPVLIGAIRDDGQFDIVWKTESTVPGDAWSDYLPGSKELVADWSGSVRCGKYNIKTGICLDQGK